MKMGDINKLDLTKVARERERESTQCAPTTTLSLTHSYQCRTHFHEHQWVTTENGPPPKYKSGQQWPVKIIPVMNGEEGRIISKTADGLQSVISWGYMVEHIQ